MKLHLPKQLFTALLAAITLAAPATLSLGSSAWGEDVNDLNIGGAPGNFWAGNYAFSFQIDENDLNAETDTSDVLALYWGEFSDADLYTNGITLTTTDGGISLYVGDGSKTNAGDDNTNAAIKEATTFAGSRGKTFSTMLDVGATYTLVNVGANGAQTVMLLKDGVYQETVEYNGNMYGGTQGTSIKSVWNDDYATGNVLVWNGKGDSATFEVVNFIGGSATLASSDLIFASGISDVTVTVNVSGEVAAGSISVYDNYTFNATAATTLTTTSGLTIASDKTLTLAGAAITLQDTALSGEISNGGTLNLAGSISVAENQTATISGAGTKVLNSLTKTGEGVLNLGALKGALTNATLTGTLTVSGGTVQFTGTSEEDAADTPSFVHLVRNLETSGTGKVKVDGDVLLNLMVGNPTGAADKTITIDDAIEITGKLQLKSYATSNATSADGDGLRKWVISDGADLSVGGELHMSNRQKLVVSGGKLTANGGIKLGYDNTTSDYYSVMVLSGGEVKTSGINLWQNRVETAFSMTGGRLEFTPASETTSVITATNTGSTTTISGGTLVAGSSSWLLNLDANDSIGNVEFEIATGKTVTLGGTLGITGALTHNGAGTLKFADNAEVSITTDALNTLRRGAAEVANGENGLSALQYYLVEGTGTVSTGSNVTLTVGGSSDGGYSFANGIISSGTQVYVINTSKSTADASTDTDFAGAGLYQVNSGATFTIAGNISETTTVEGLLQTTLGTGTIALTSTGDKVLSASTVFEGTLQVGAGVNLKIGSNANSVVNVETLSGIKLEQGGKVTYSGKSSTIKSVAVTGNSTFAIDDMYSDNTSAATAVLTIEQLSVDSGTTLTSYAEWKHNLAIGKLTGEGEVNITGSGYTGNSVGKSSSLTINSLQGFTGNLSITSKETSAGKNVYTATVSTGESAVDMGSLSFNDFTGSRGTATLNVQGDLSVDTLTAETATVNVSEGKTLALGNGTTEATHSIGTLSAASATVTVNDKSTLNLGAAAHTVGTLTGSGALAVTGTDSVTGSLVVKSATTGYTGNISLEKASMSVWGLADFTVQSLTLNNATFSVNTRHDVSTGGNHTYTLNNVVVSGDDSVISVAADHKFWEAQINIDNLINTEGDATLTLESNYKNSTRNVFNLKGGAFSGTIKFVGSSAGGARLYALNINSAAVVENAVIDVSKTTDYAHKMAIGIGYETVTVKGLTGGIAGAGIYSGSQDFGTEADFSSDSTFRTLVIDADTDNSASPYTTSVAVSSNLNLEKKGLGTQVFTGDMSAFNGTIMVTGGKLAFTDSAGFSTSSAAVSNGAELALGGTTTIDLLTATDSAVSLESGAALTLSGGTAEALTSHSIGTLKANGGSLSLADYASLSIGTLEMSSTLDLTQGANGAELTITNLSVVDGATLEAAEDSTIVYIGSLDATTGTADGNGYKAALGNVILIKGYEWKGSMDGVSSKDGNTYLTSSAPVIQGTTYYVQSGAVTVGGTNATAGVADATSFDVAENTTLVIAELPTGWTTTDLLTGKVTGTGRIQMATGITVNNTDTVTTFAGELEVTGEGTVFTVEGQQNNYVNLTNLSNIVVNNGAQVTYHATPEARDEGVTTPHLQKLSVESGTGTFWFKDANQDQNPTLIIGEAAVASGATLKLTSEWQDSAITIQKLTGGGEDGTGKLDVYSPDNGSVSGVVNIQSLKDFTGALKFTKDTGNNFSATVATGSDGANFKSLEVDYSNTSGTAGFTFNVGGNTTIGTLSVGYGTVALGENVTLTLGGGKSDELAEHSISTLTTAAGAGVKLGDYASLELVSTQPNGYAGDNTGNADSTASLELAISGGTGSVLKLHMDTNAGWGYNNTVKLSALTGETKTVDEVHVSGVLAADVYSGTASTNLGGAKLVMADASKLELRKSGGTVNFGAGDIQLQGATTMELYGDSASTTRTLTNNISGDTLKTASDGAAELTGSVDLKALHVGSSKVTLAGDTDKKLQKLSAASGKETAIAAGTTLQMVDAQKTTKVSFSSTDEVNAATMTAKSDTALAQLAEDASFTIEDMTLVNTTITAATVNTRVNLKNVSGDATLKTGTFALQVSANAPDNVGMSYAVTGTPSLTLASATEGDTKLVIAADPTADVSGAYGTYTLTFNLNLDLDASISSPATGNAWQELVGFEGWLGTMLTNQEATYTYLPADEVEVAQVDAGTSTPTVSYSYTAGTGGNVGTLAIVITGLNVPEPATSTLSLLALAALAARRRRND